MAKRFVTTKVEVEGREETKVVELPTREPEPWGDDAWARGAASLMLEELFRPTLYHGDEARASLILPID